jgi:hypothetical protein
MVTTVDFGANYFVLGELATAAELSLSLVAGESLTSRMKWLGTIAAPGPATHGSSHHARHRLAALLRGLLRSICASGSTPRAYDACTFEEPEGLLIRPEQVVNGKSAAG